MKPFLLTGGIDLITPKAAVPAGRLEDCENYEVGTQPGYQLCEGFERFDGRMSPSVRDIWDVVLTNTAYVPLYTSKVLDFTNEDATPHGVAFNDDGTVVCVLGTTTDVVYKYFLAVAWDISTVLYSNESFDVSSQTTAGTDIAFSADGLNMYISDSAGVVYQYVMTIAWDISSATYSDSQDFSGTEANIQGFCFGNSGASIYTVGATDTIYQFNLTTAWDIDTASTTAAGSIGWFNAATLCTGLAWDENGTRLYVDGGSAQFVFTYSANTAWDISDSFEDFWVLDTSSEITSSTGIFLKPNGSALYVIDVSDADMHQYATGFDVNERLTWATDEDTGHIGTVIATTTGIGNVTLRLAYWTSKSYIAKNATVTGASGGATLVNGLGGTFNTGRSKTVSFPTLSDLVTNGGFATDTDWTKGTGWSISAGTASCDGTQVTNTVLSQSISGLEPSSKYLLEFTVSGFSAGVLTAKVGGVTFVTTASNGAKSQAANVGNTNALVEFSGDASFVGSIDNVTLTPIVQDAYDIHVTGAGEYAYVLCRSPYGYVLQYSMNTGSQVLYDIEGASYDQAAAIISQPIGCITMNPAGTMMFAGASDANLPYSTANGTVYAFTLTAGDISTIASAGSLSVADKTSDIDSLAFSADGTKLYVAGSQNQLYQYNLSTAWDITTGTYYATKFVQISNGYIRGIGFSPDGLSCYILDTAGYVAHWRLSTAWDLTTIGYSGYYFDVGTAHTGLCIQNGYMYLTNTSTEVVSQYVLTDNVSSTALKDVATDVDDYADQLYAASQVLRSAIKPVPGSGPVVGIKWYKNQQTAVRDYARFRYFLGKTMEAQIGQHVVVMVWGWWGDIRTYFGDEGIVRDITVTGNDFMNADAEGIITIEPLGQDFRFDEPYIPTYPNSVVTLTELFFSSGSTEPTQGQTLTGQTSTETVLVYRVELHSGAWADGDATGIIYCAEISGVMTPGEDMDIGATTNVLTFDNYIYPSHDITRGLALASERLHDGGDMAGMYRSSMDGWQRVDLGYEIKFDNGTNEPTPVRFGADTSSQVKTATDWAVATSYVDESDWTASAGTVIDAVGASGGAYVYPADGFDHENFLESTDLALYGFDFDIPTGARITGIEIEVTAKNTAAGTGGAAIVRLQPYIFDGLGSVRGTVPGAVLQGQASGDLTTSLVAYTFGGEDDLLGTSIDYATVMAATFGCKFRFEFETDVTISAVQCDLVRMRVHYVEQGTKIYLYDAVAGEDYTTARLVHKHLLEGTWGGTQLLDDPGMDDSGAWTAGTGWTVGSGVATCDASQGADSDLTEAAVSGLTEGNIYEVQFTVSSYSAGNVCAVVGDTEGTDRSANGTYVERITCGSGADFDIRGDVDFDGVIDNVSLKAVGSAQGIFHIYDLLKKRVPTVNVQIRSAADGAGDLIADMVGGESLVSLPGSALLNTVDSKYEMIAENVYARDDLEAVYGVSGAGPAFSYDGFYTRLIRTGLSSELDKPRHIDLFQFRLWLGYGFGEASISVAGEPLSFDGSLNAVATGFGRPITGFMRLAGKTMGVLTDQSTYSVTVDGADFDQQIFAPKVGAIEYTVKDAGATPMYADARGVSTPAQSEKYGDFEVSPISHMAHPWLLPRLQGRNFGDTARDKRVVATTVSRAKNQYRMYFADGKRMTMTFTPEGPQITRQFLYTDGNEAQYIKVFVTDNDVDDLGHDRMFFTMDINPDFDHGNDLGYVYEEDRGTSFDGAAFKRWMELSPIAGPDISTTNIWSTCHLYGMTHGYAELKLTTQKDFNHPLDADDTTEDNRYSVKLGAIDNDAMIKMESYFDKFRVQRRGRHLTMRFQEESTKTLPYVLQNLSVVVEIKGRQEL